MSSKETCRNELRTAIRQLSDRCLYSASKWAAEQLIGIEQDPAKFTPSNTRFQRGSSSIRRRFRTNEITSTPPTDVAYVSTPVMEEDEAIHGDFYLLAKSYFDCREYRRAAHVLRNQTGKKSVFLRCYALYLAGEKRKEEEMIELEGPLGKNDAINRELVSLERELSTLCKNNMIDPFGLYCMVLVAISCTTVGILNSLNLSNHWMKEFFLASVYQELRMHNESLSKYENLHVTFTFSNYIQAQIAKAQYSLREFDQVEVIFEDLLRNDPYRVDDMDTYSNVLYTKEYFSALSYLAHRLMPIDGCGHKSSGLSSLPIDSRLWIAMAQCYESEQLHMLEEPSNVTKGLRTVMTQKQLPCID
ncbi:Anaphase-promoting complex subunit 8 [Hibiscus syriacus]|uniref:Anaphase-promoting complex subunit 8 n=1 Tax=Hibiscus syriacus TaxID=106335 RepID=A0A6A2ZT14_HIBSY|nr:Anaphase-promoting complex subunit 8 [Hibiscus syriacus]